MSKSKLPPKWVNVYPQGTQEGDEEQAFFISLSRHPKFQWRSISQLVIETNLSEKRIDEIISKYYKKNMIYQNPLNVNQWGYWERVQHMLPREEENLTDFDHHQRINEIKNKEENN